MQTDGDGCGGTYYVFFLYNLLFFPTVKKSENQLGLTKLLPSAGGPHFWDTVYSPCTLLHLAVNRWWSHWKETKISLTIMPMMHNFWCLFYPLQHHSPLRCSITDCFRNDCKSFNSNHLLKKIILLSTVSNKNMPNTFLLVTGHSAGNLGFILDKCHRFKDKKSAVSKSHIHGLHCIRSYLIVKQSVPSVSTITTADLTTATQYHVSPPLARMLSNVLR